MADAWQPVLAAQCVVLALGLAWVLAALRRGARAVGPPLRVARGGRAARLGASAVLAAALALALAAGEGAPSTWALAAVALAALVAWLRPHPDDELCGRDGLRRGWRSCAFAELEEWRLTGRHLRVRSGGRWLAVALPPERFPEVEARLRALAPERESPYR